MPFSCPVLTLFKIYSRYRHMTFPAVKEDGATSKLSILAPVFVKIASSKSAWVGR